jgi:hypothetical protein
MEARQHRYNAEIPGAYTASEYPLEYYFEITHNAKSVVLYPGLSETLTKQPYFVVRRA